MCHNKHIQLVGSDPRYNINSTIIKKSSICICIRKTFIIILVKIKDWLGRIFLWDVDFRALHKVNRILLVGYTWAAVCITDCHYPAWLLITSYRKPYLCWDVSSAKITRLSRDYVPSNFTQRVSFIYISFII